MDWGGLGCATGHDGESEISRAASGQHVFPSLLSGRRPLVPVFVRPSPAGRRLSPAWPHSDGERRARPGQQGGWPAPGCRMCDVDGTGRSAVMARVQILPVPADLPRARSSARQRTSASAGHPGGPVFFFLPHIVMAHSAGRPTVEAPSTPASQRKTDAKTKDGAGATAGSKD